MRAGEGHEGGASREPLTEELLERLLSAASAEAYLTSEQLCDRSLADYLNGLAEAKGFTRADVVRATGITPPFVYQIFNGERGVGRDTALRLAFGCHCSLREAQLLLRHAGMGELWARNRRDAIIIYCLEHGYTAGACDDELFRFGEQTLSSKGH